MLQLHNQDYLRKVPKLQKFSIYYQYLLKDLFILLPIKSVFAFKNLHKRENVFIPIAFAASSKNSSKNSRSF